MTGEPTDRCYHKQTEEYQKCWRLHSDDGVSPELDYNELILTIVTLYDKIAELEERLNELEPPINDVSGPTGLIGDPQ